MLSNTISPSAQVALRANVSGSDQNIATGHLMRCSRLGLELQKRGFVVELWVNPDELVDKLAPSLLNRVYVSNADDLVPPGRCAADFGAIIIDLPDEPQTVANDSLELKKLCELGVNLIKLGHTRFVSDYFAAVICLYPTKKVFMSNYYEGSDYLVLDHEFLRIREEIDAGPARGQKVEEIFVSMGGVDLDDRTHLAITALEKIGFAGKVTVVVGAAYPYFEKLQLKQGTVPFTLELHQGINDVGRLMARADLGLAAFGTTAYELVGLRVPVACVTHKPWQAASAASFEDLGAVKYLGSASDLDASEIAQGLDPLINDVGLRESLANAGADAIDFRGVERVATIVENTFRSKEPLDDLFIMAHPGDELFSSAGTILTRVQSGRRVGLLVLGDGYLARAFEGKGPLWERVTSRESFEALNSSARTLGISQLYAYKLPDNSFDTIPFLKIVKIVERVVELHRPTTVYTNCPSDLNIDHQLTAKAVVTAVRPGGACSVDQLFYVETPSSTDWGVAAPGSGPGFSANWFQDISPFLEQKLRALEIYSGELREDPHPQSLGGLKDRARQWGRLSGCNAAEAFQLVRQVSRASH